MSFTQLPKSGKFSEWYRALRGFTISQGNSFFWLLSLHSKPRNEKPSYGVRGLENTPILSSSPKWGENTVNDKQQNLKRESKQEQDHKFSRSSFHWMKALDWAYTGWSPADRYLDRLIDRYNRKRD